MKLPEALAANFISYFTQKWFQLVSGQFEKQAKVIQRWKNDIKIDVSTGSSQRFFWFSFALLRDTLCHYSLITYSGIQISFSIV